MPLALSRRRFVHLTGIAAAASLLPAAAMAAPVTLRVGYIPIIPMTQLFVMQGEGWTGKAGLKLELTQFSSGPAMVQALASGSLDVAYVGIGPAMVARSRGIDIKVLASNIIDQVALIGRGPFAEMMAAAPSAAEGFRSFFERAGRPAKIATLPTGSVPDTILRYYLNRVAKADPKHVEIVGVGEDQVQQALLAGAVEGASILEPILTIVQERDPTARIVAPASTMLPRQPGAVLAVRETVIAAHRDAVATLVELHVRATEFARSRQDRAADHVTAFVGKGLVDPRIIDKALRSPSTNLVADPHVIREATAVLQDFQQTLGTQVKPVNLDDLFDYSFYDAVPKAG
ncbi:ABC transporter substrate-binding protein [Skermanella mucosa]|uniref:ABC transporter substrate-binding protein n=1 Tax=Skermanella mucosa TaxID=1789672 RepID=UPI00192BBE59|nr:ABC transporter substrate-binding protein [Skermanella mucosa]UEM19060.1 ABC transporter substrate-binding protein [Skermanella mucosa]